MSNEKRIELSNGGIAWITVRPSFGQKKIHRRHLLRLQRFLGTDGMVRPDLTAEERDQFEGFYSESEEVLVRTYVTRSDGVLSPSGEPLSLPADLERADGDDIATLTDAIATVLSEGRADPNAGGRPSASSPRRSSSRRTHPRG